MANVTTVKGDREVSEEQSKPDTTVYDFLDKAKKRVRMMLESESELREAMLSDMEFRGSEQWNPQVKADRDADGRPTLTINRIPQFIRQVTNAQRASRPGIQVNPIDSGADPKTAEALQGVIRSIEINSDADVAYSTGGEHQVTCGRGYWRVITEYSDDDGYEQNIVIRRCPNPLAVGLDPSHIEVDGKDARFGFIFEDIPKDLFEERYGEEAVAAYQAWMTGRDRTPEWMPEGRFRVAEYLYKEFERETVVDLRLPSIDGQGFETIVCLKEDVPSEKPDDWKVTNERTIERPRVYWALITPSQILEGNEDKTAGKPFPSRYIPIIQVLGDELNIDGKRDLRGMVRDSKDAQKMYSFWASSLTEVIGLTPRAPYIGYAGQFKNFESKWNQANRKSYAYLEVNPVTVGGNIASLPQRQQFEPAIQSIVEAFRLADNDLKAVMGLYDASLGANGPEQSGKAILARQRQGELGNSIFQDNLSRAIRHTGRILLDMIPRVLSPVRIMRILGADDKTEKIVIHNGAQQDAEAIAAAEGVQRIFDISVGRYDVSISSGTSYQSRRQEAVDALLSLINSYPDAAPVIGDLLVGNMDWPGAAKIAARLKRAVPKHLLDQDDPDFDPTPPDVQAHMQEVEKAFKELQQQMQAEMVRLQAEAAIKEKELASKERIADIQEQTKIGVAKLKADVDQGQVMLEHELEVLRTRMEILSEGQTQAQKLQHEAAMTNTKLEGARALTESKIEGDRAMHEHKLTQSEEMHEHKMETAKEKAAFQDARKAKAAKAAKAKPKK